MVSDFHRRGVRVLFPMMMWDQGTKDPGTDWPTAFADFMKQIDADGVNGDTQDGVPLAFSLAAEKAGHPLAFEPEGGPSDEALAWNVLTWGQYQYTFAPGSMDIAGSNRVTRSIFKVAGIAIKPTLCNTPSSTAKVGKAGKMSGVSGTVLLHATQRQPAAWQPSSARWLRSSPAKAGSRSTHAPIRCLCKPLAAGGPDSVDHRQPQ